MQKNETTTSLVEILLGTYNGAGFLREQIDSILSQTYTNWRLIIRDDGSADATLQIIEEYIARYPDKIRLISDGQQNLGSSGNFMTLLSLSSAPYVMFCDQDDVWFDDKVERSLVRLKEMEQQKSTAMPLMVFTDLTVIDATGKVLHNSFWHAQKLSPEITTKVYKTVAQSTVTGCTILLNRAAVEKIPANRVRQFQHDHWISISVAYFGYIAYLEQPSIFYRLHGKNDVGLKKPTAGYLAERLRNGYDLFQSWVDIKRTTAIKFSITAVLLFKIVFNVKRLWRQLLNK